MQHLNKDCWVKKEGNKDYDVPTGRYDGVNMCKSLGSYLLDHLCNVLDKHPLELDQIIGQH